MKKLALLMTVILLGACASEVPDSGQGIGFGSPSEFEFSDAGETSAMSGPFVESDQISDEVLEPQQPVRSNVEITTNNPGISDEQDFNAVASRESIQSDRERLAAQREAFKIVETTALPTRRTTNEPSIVEFALSTNHAIGVSVYSRTGLSGQNRFNRNCAKYASPDLAQAAFLKAGGPERDRFGIDPDGDGYACYWNPSAFRAALGQ